jgi:hypothetical protein
MSQRELLSHLLLEEIEEEEFLIEEILVGQGNANEHPLFTSRPEEGFFEILVNRHLIHDDKKFREFFRLNIDQFNYILQLIEKNIRKLYERACGCVYTDNRPDGPCG